MMIPSTPNDSLPDSSPLSTTQLLDLLVEAKSREGTSASPIDTSAALETYLAECMARRLSRSTIYSYKYHLEHLAAVSPTLPVSVDPIIELQRSQTFESPESHKDLWRILKTFLKWASKKYGVPNVLADVPGPQGQKVLPRTLEQDEIEHLLATTGDRRDFAMIVLILDTGMRLGDLANLRWPHVEANRLLLVKAKGGKQRHVYIRPETRAALAGLGDGYHIWVSTQPGIRRGTPMSQGGIREAIARCLRRAGFRPPKAGPHMLRHTYGRHFIRNGGSLPHLQRVLGHSSVISTQIYITLNDEDLEGPQHDFSPVWTGVHNGGKARGPAPGPEIITMCSQCHKVKNGLADWVNPSDLAELPDRDKISHGICPTCVRENYPKPLADKVLRNLVDQN